MFDPFLGIVLSTTLLFLLLIFFVSRRVSEGNLNVVIRHSKPEAPKMWTGSSVDKNFDDKGKLEITESGLSFKGANSDFHLGKGSINEISPFKSQSPWRVVIILNILAVLGIGYSLIQGSPIFLVIVLCLVVLDGMVLVMGTGTEWIEVKYHDKGTLKKIYIGQGASRLFPQMRGVFGGNTYLYQKIKAVK